MDFRVSISHWLPLVTICPVNKLPDLLYVTVTFNGKDFKELYGIRKRIRKVASWKTRFMEGIALDISEEFPDAAEVKIQLVTGRHIVIITRGIK